MNNTNEVNRLRWTILEMNLRGYCKDTTDGIILLERRLYQEHADSIIRRSDETEDVEELRRLVREMKHWMTRWSKAEGWEIGPVTPFYR